MAVSQTLLDHAIESALGAIEVYNKPCSAFREQSFVILMTTAWELLLKAKLVFDAGDTIEVIYARTSAGKVKTGRSGNPITIELLRAADLVTLPAAVVENLRRIVEIRDSAVHLYVKDSAIKYLVFVLGVASLKNFQRLVSSWFARSLADYNLCILPLAFAYNFNTLSTLDIAQKPEAVHSLLKSVQSDLATIQTHDGYDFVCEIRTQLVSAKALVEDPAITVAIQPGAESTIVVKWQRPIDKYPLSYSELIQRVKTVRPRTKQAELTALFKQHNIKDNKAYSYYSFATKKHEEAYLSTGKLPSAIASIYNEDAVQFIL